MSTTLDYEKVKQELVVYLRNSDVYTTTARSVTTKTDTGTFAIATASLAIARSNVKNIRSITIVANPLIFGVDYTVDYDYSGTCVITFTVPQTGAWSIVYDYGTDKIFTDLPRNDLSVSSFPRIAIDIIGDDSQDIEIGAMTKLTTFSFAIYVYDFKVHNIDATLTTIKNKMLTYQKSFYYQKYVQRIRTGPLMIFQVYGETKIMFKSIDFMSKYNLEYV